MVTIDDIINKASITGFSFGTIAGTNQLFSHTDINTALYASYFWALAYFALVGQVSLRLYLNSAEKALLYATSTGLGVLAGHHVPYLALLYIN